MAIQELPRYNRQELTDRMRTFVEASQMVRLIATPEGPKEVEPSTAVVSHVTAIESFLTVRSSSCKATNFFASVETASRYVSQHPGLVIVPVDDVFQLWSRVWSAKENLIRR